MAAKAKAGGRRQASAKPKPAKRPRLKKFDVKKKAALLKEITAGRGVTVAARRVGISYARVNQIMHEDPEFHDAVREAEAIRDAELVDDALAGLRQAAKDGNPTACQVILYNRDPDNWRDARRLEHTGPGGGPIRADFNLKHKHDDLSAEELRDLYLSKIRGHGLAS